MGMIFKALNFSASPTNDGSGHWHGLQVRPVIYQYSSMFFVKNDPNLPDMHSKAKCKINNVERHSRSLTLNPKQLLPRKNSQV